MSNILPWPALIKRLCFLMDVDEAQLAGHLGVDEPTVHRWERGILVPERKMQKIVRDKLHRLEPAISARSIEAMTVISAIHCNISLGLCCAASQPYADAYEMRADEMRYLMVHHMWNACSEQAAGSPIGTTNMALWIGAVVEKPDHLQEGDFDLSITTLDDLLL